MRGASPPPPTPPPLRQAPEAEQRHSRPTLLSESKRTFFGALASPCSSGPLCAWRMHPNSVSCAVGPGWGSWRRCHGGRATGDLGPIDKQTTSPATQGGGGASFPGGGAMGGALGRWELSARIGVNRTKALSTLTCAKKYYLGEMKLFESKTHLLVPYISHRSQARRCVGRI